MGPRLLVPLFCCCLAVAARGQFERVGERHARISDLYDEERYPEVVREVELQLQEVPGTPFQDSVYRYMYKYARAKWKTAGADEAARAAEHTWALIARWDRDPERRVTALGDLSWIYYELGRVPECLRVDSMALDIALRHASELSITVRGKAHHYLAFDYDAIGEHNKALHHFQAAMRIYEQADTLMPISMAETSTGMGVSSWRMGRIRDAERYYRRSLELLANDSSINGLGRRASANGNLGLLWQDAGDLARSKQFYQASIDLCQRIAGISPDPARRDEAVLVRAKGYLNLATIYFAIGDHKHARELLERSLRDRLSVLEPDDPQVLRVHESFAELELSVGEYDKAVRSLNTYLAGALKRYGRRSGDYAVVCARLAEAEGRRGNLARADSLFNESIAAATALVGGDTDPKLAETYGRRGNLYLDKGRPERAAEDLARSRAILARIHGATNYRVTGREVMLAQARFESGDTAGALMYADTALASLRERMEALRAPVPRQFAMPHLLPDAVYWKVRTERATTADPAGREEEWLDRLDMAITSLQRNKAVLTDEASRLLLIGAQKRLFELALAITADRYARTGAERDVQRFLHLSEADRSILLKGRLNAFTGLRFAGVPDAVIAREEELVRLLEFDPDAPHASGELLKNEKAYAAFLDSLGREHPRYFALRYGDEPVPLEEVRGRLLTPQRQLLIYADAGEELHALVVRVDTAVLVPLRGEGLKQAVEALRNAVDDRATTAYLHAASDLYERIFAPVRPWLTGDELLIVPDGPLHGLNFEVLLETPSTAGDFRDHLLLKHYAIAQLLSVTTAVQFARLDAPRKGDVLALAPGFTDDLKQRYIAGLRDTSLIDRGYLHLVRQPFAVRAAEDLGRSFSASILLGAQATEKGFREQAAGHGVLHLGTHAEMNPIAPMYSRLVLSKDDDTASTDGYLHAYELYELDLRAQLAVLTACETGTGRNDDGEGVRSLGHAFAYAGCPSLVMSLWKIDEKVSSEVIARFYRYLSEGMPKHKALRQAKLDHLDKAQDELALPYYWAGMVLVGDVTPVEVGGTRWWWWLIGALLVALAAVLLWRRRPERPVHRS